jgi:hypothetical protein
VLTGNDIGWLKEVLDSVAGDVEEYDPPASLKPVGRPDALILPPSRDYTDKDVYLAEHDYFEKDDGQPVVEDDVDQVAVTTAFFMEEMEDRGMPLSPKDPKFEFHFRAFLHNFEHSYNTQTIAETIKRLKETTCS